MATSRDGAGLSAIYHDFIQRAVSAVSVATDARATNPIEA